MGNHIEKDCRNCHLGNMSLMDCWDGCMDNPDHPLWQPQTNYDRIGDMTEDELVELWGRLDFPEQFWRHECKDCPREAGCSFSIACCPETFGNWLRSKAN